MQAYLFSDSADMLNGMHLAGVDGEKITDEKALAAAYKRVAANPEIAVILITAAVCRNYPAYIDSFRSHSFPLITELPDEQGLSGGPLAGQLRGSVGIVI